MPIHIDTNIDLKLSEISPFKEMVGLPENSVLHKGRTAIGVTYKEMKAKRHSIIPVPTKQIILNKLSIEEHQECIPVDNLFPVFGGEGMTLSQRLIAVKKFLASDIEDKKIFSTPDSFWYIIEAAKDLGILESIYNDFFLFVDEYHAYASEAYRLKMLDPFKYFWKFKSKCFASATPFLFKDENFDTLTHYKIEFGKQKLGKIDLVVTDNVPATLNYLLIDKTQYKGNVHIFYNLVKYLAEQLRMVITEQPQFDCNIFCSPKKENFDALAELKDKFFQPIPKTENFKKFNFYTSRHFEGWDLFDEDATIILLTDIASISAKVGIGNKGVQAIGRCRNTPHQIIHITNCRNLTTRRTVDEVYRQVELDSESAIEAYNRNYQQAEERDLKPKDRLKEDAEKYADFDSNSFAIVNNMKLAQNACAEYYNEDFNSPHFIKKAWKDAYYDVEMKKVMIDSLPDIKNRNQSKKLRMWCEKLRDLDNGIYLNTDLERSKLASLRNSMEDLDFAHCAYTLLGMETLETHCFNVKNVNALLNDKNKEIARGIAYNQILETVPGRIRFDYRYPYKELKKLLQEIYEECNFRNDRNKVITAKAIDIFEIFEKINSDIKLIAPGVRKYLVIKKNSYISIERVP